MYRSHFYTVLTTISSVVERHLKDEPLIFIAVLASFGLFGFAYYYPYLVSGEDRLCFRTESFTYHQYYYFVWEMYQKGEFPIWNPYILSGIPTFGNTGFGFLNPFAILGSLLYDPSHSFLDNTRVFVYITLLLVFIGNIGTYLLFCELGVSRSIAVITSIWYAFSGVNLVKNIYVEEATINYLFPFVILFLYKYVKHGKVHYLAYNSIILAIIISTTHVVLIIYTYLQYILLSLLAIAFSFNYKPGHSKEGRAGIVLSRNILLFLPLLGGVILASIAIFPYVEYLRNATTEVKPLTLGQVEQLEPHRCILNIFTILFVHNYLVLGLISLAGLLFYRHEFKKYILIVLTFYFLLGLKQYGLLERLMYIFTPLGSYLLPRHYHYEVWYFMPLYAIMLFAFGLEVYLGRVLVSRGMKLVPIVLGIISLLLIGGSLRIHKLAWLAMSSLEFIHYQATPGFISRFMEKCSVDESQLILYFFLWALFVVLLLRVYDRIQEVPAKALSVFILLVIVLHPNQGAYLIGLNGIISLNNAKTCGDIGDSYHQEQRAFWEQGMLARRHMTLHSYSTYVSAIYKKRFDVLGIARLWPRRYREFLQASNLPVMGFQEVPFKISRNERPVDFHLAQLLAVDFDEVQRVLQAYDTGYVPTSTEYRPFNRFEVIPKYVVETSKSRIIPETEVLDLMRVLDLRRYVVLEETPRFPSIKRPEVGVTDSNVSVDGVTIQEFSENRLKVHVNCTQEKAFLFYSQNYYPGWKARVDGVSTPVYRADYTFQAIPITRGKHSIVLEFDPWLFKISKWITIISCLTCMVLILRTYNWELPESLNVKL